MVLQHAKVDVIPGNMDDIKRKLVAGADPGPGKGRGTDRPSCRWLGRVRFCC